MYSFYWVSFNESQQWMKSFIFDGSIFKMVVGDAPPNPLEDSNVNPKMKTMEEGVGVCSLIRSISGVRRMC